MKKMNIYIDMDGTLAEWQWVGPDTYTQKGYYSSLKAIKSMVDTAKKLYTDDECDVYILSSVLQDKHSLEDKQKWLDQYLPEIPRMNRYFVPYGESKTKYIDSIGTNILIDDYNGNLDEWKGIPIKFMNGVNGGSGEWHGFTIDYRSTADCLKKTIKALGKEGLK